MSFFSVSNVQIAGLSACVPVMKDDILSVYSKWGKIGRASCRERV